MATIAAPATMPIAAKSRVMANEATTAATMSTARMADTVARMS